MTSWPEGVGALAILLKIAVGTTDPRAAVHRQVTLGRSWHGPRASVPTCRMGAVVAATQGGQPTVANPFVKEDGPGNGGTERPCRGAGEEAGMGGCYVGKQEGSPASGFCFVNN